MKPPIQSNLSPMQPRSFRFHPLGLSSLLLLAACGPTPNPVDANVDAHVDTSHEAVLAIMRTSCVFSACHGGTRAGAGMLNFQPVLDGTTDLRELMVDQPACEYSDMPLVTEGNPDQSWLWLKLDGPHSADRRITFTPDPSWDPGIVPRADGSYPASICPLVSGGEITFGVLMPQGSGTEAPVLTPGQLATIRGWILAGAPGPS